MSEILPTPAHPVRSARPRGPRAWLLSLVVPRRALAWGRLTADAFVPAQFDGWWQP